MNWTHIILHHSATKDSETFSWGAIQKYHVEVNGWKAVGYHYGVELIADHYQVIGGRMLNETGAHCPEQGMNGKAIGICLVGNFDAEVPSEGELALAAKLVKSLMEEFRIPVHNVLGHREVKPTNCPGKLFNMERFRARL